MSVYQNILTAVQQTVQGLGLSGIDMGAINITLLPKIEQKFNSPLPQVLICPTQEPEGLRRSSFESGVFVTYRVEVIIVSAGNLVLDDTNLPVYLGWREQIRKAFQQYPLANYTNPINSYLVDSVVSFESPVDRYKINDLYDYQALTLNFLVSETNT